MEKKKKIKQIFTSSETEILCTFLDQRSLKHKLKLRMVGVFLKSPNLLRSEEDYDE